jgi:hypothetical protein
MPGSPEPTMIKTAILFLALVITCAAALERADAASAPRAPTTNGQRQPWFPIGVWFEGNPDWAGYPGDVAGARGYYGRCFADLAAHGFNAAVVPNCPESLWTTLLRSAREHGINIVLEIGPLARLVSQPEAVRESEAYAAAERIFHQIGGFESLARYQIRDEPPPEMVPNWLMVRRALAAVDPARPAFSCFNNPDSLARAREQASLAEAVFDIYPHGVNTPPQSLGHFLPALDRFMAAAGNAAPWPVLQSFAKPGSWRYPSAQELRAVTYLSLAAGAKGLLYFLYQTMPNHPERLEGLIDPDGNPTPMYATAAELARELGKLSRLLLSLKPAEPPADVQGEVRVGSFTDDAGHSVLIIASARPDQAVTAGVSANATHAWQDALTAERFTPKEGRLSVPLGPGGGRVLVEQVRGD